MNFTLTTARRRMLAGAAAVAIAGSIIAVSAPMATGAGGDNTGAPVAGMSAGPDITKKDRSAVINADGSIARGKGIVSVTHSAGAGSYIVFFNKNVTACNFQGTIGLSGSSGTSARGFITVVGAAAGDTGVFVTTDDVAGSPAERGFHLYVGC